MIRVSRSTLFDGAWHRAACSSRREIAHRNIPNCSSTGFGYERQITGLPRILRTQPHELCISNAPYKLCVVDLSGTIVDPGVKAPTEAMMKTFRSFKIPINEDVIRKPMGLHKKDHIRTILANPLVSKLWKIHYDTFPEERHVEKLYKTFEKIQLNILPNYCHLFSDNHNVLQALRKRYGLKVGVTTGFNQLMMDVVLHGIEKHHGFVFDSAVASDEVKYGRPAPDMIRRNMALCNVNNPRDVVKIGDTPVDMEEGKVAGCGLVVGVSRYSNAMGMDEQELYFATRDNPEIVQRRLEKSEKELKDAGADVVVKELKDIYLLIRSRQM